MRKFKKGDRVYIISKTVQGYERDIRESDDPGSPDMIWFREGYSGRMGIIRAFKRNPKYPSERVATVGGNYFHERDLVPVGKNESETLINAFKFEKRIKPVNKSLYNGRYIVVVRWGTENESLGFEDFGI